MLKKFNSYLVSRSKNPNDFNQQVIFASAKFKCDIFKVIEEESQLFSESTETPVIVWDDFKFTSKILNENRFSVYNVSLIPPINEIFSKFDLASIPKSTNDRHQVKDLKFPILASNYKTKKEFKTYNSFKKAEENFDFFRENPKVNHKFNVIIFNNNPIHIEESINGIGFDVNIPRFKYLNEIEKITEAFSQKYIFDLYKLELVESNNKLYLLDINRTGELNMSQKTKIYESVYEFHYSRRLPIWYKNKVFKNKINEYYKKSYYNSLLLKPKYSINFEKYK